MTSIQDALRLASETLKPTSDTAKLDAQVLLCHVIEQNKTYLHTWLDKSLSPEQFDAFNALIAKRQQGHPVAHLTGEREFWDLTLKVNPSTLIPRPDTEILVETAINRLSDFVKAGHFEPADISGLDLGTGTGALALAMAKSMPESQWLGVDFSAEAVELAKANAALNGVSNCSFKQSDWFENVTNTAYQIIVSNPPYIDPDDPHLDEGDVQFEPKSALTADEHGLADLKLIANLSPQFMSKPGIVIMEHGYDQGSEVRTLLSAAGFENVETIQDLGRNDRITLGYLL